MSSTYCALKYNTVPFYLAGIFLFVSISKYFKEKKSISNSTQEKVLSLDSPSRLKRKSSTDNLEGFLTPVSNSTRLVQPLVKKIDSSSSSDLIIIGIAGGSGSGKTTLAKAIYDSIGEV